MNQKSRNKTSIHLMLVVSIVIAAAAAFLTFIFLTVAVFAGSSMSPTLKTGDVLLTVKGLEVERGDMVAFYHGNNRIVRRCIGIPGDEINIDEEGNVFVNGEELDEPYLEQTTAENGDLTYPYQVPAGRYFVLGDNRKVASDSRSSIVGCISKEQLAGKVLFRIWPLSEITVFSGN
ncbi:MAG: signal peptidase I [Eubacteriales bacterium]|nr:signal peptidase I [Eubacteriales bacterium]